MKSSSLIRTGSLPVQKSILSGSPRVSLSREASFTGDKNHLQSPNLSMHFNSNGRRDMAANGVNRASMIRSASENFGLRRNPSRTRNFSFPEIIPDEEDEFLSEDEILQPSYVGVRQMSGIPVEEFGFGGGSDDGGDHGIATLTGGNGGDRIKIGAYYEEMLKSNPGDPLLLRNYGKFLHEVEKNMAKAEEYYGRAILANPGDGELLSLYGKLIWEKERDEERAKSYFDQAIHASPDDCTVLGSYAHFMWEAEGEEEEEEVTGGGMRGKAEESAVKLIAAF